MQKFNTQIKNTDSEKIAKMPQKCQKLQKIPKQLNCLLFEF